MIILGNTLLSDELYMEQFVCDLPACLGGCCVEGDSGAPLEESETAVLQQIYPTIKPFMIDEGIATVEQGGPWVKDFQGELTTPLVKGKQCAYVFYDGKGIAKCAIEKAWEQGLVDFKKPVSCHLYPIRATKHPNYEALNYHRWPLCDPARRQGKKLKVRVYRFLKEALIRRYGSDWYHELEEYIRFTYGEK